MRSTFVLCLWSTLSAAAVFEPVPGLESGTQTGLTLRVVRYDGSTNGTITVELRNPTATAAVFDPKGLFFVPNVNPDRAPQRLGAVGAFLRAGETTRTESLTLAAGASATLALDVYCIDSHRPSPSSETPFRLGRDRMPKELARTIDVSTKNAAQSYGGTAAPAAKSSVQREVWNSRNAKWISLDGEGAQEAKSEEPLEHPAQTRTPTIRIKERTR